MTDVTLAVSAVESTPLDYAVPGAAQLVIKMLSASYNGSGAVGNFVPAVQLIIGGTIVAGTFPLGSTVTAGASVDVSWFPGVAAQASSSPSSTSSQLFVTAAGTWPSLTNGASFPNRVESSTNLQDVYLVDFANGAVSFAQATFAMPALWDASTVTATFYWLVNGTNTGNVVWAVQGRAYGSGSTLDQAWGAVQSVTSAATGTANQVIISSVTSAITLAGTPAAGQLAQWRFQRTGTSASDTLATTARLLGVQISYGLT